MKSSLILSAAGALAIGLASLAATTAPAAADGLYFGFGFGDGDGGFRHHHGPRPPMYGWAPPPAYGWAPPPPPRQVCEPRWVNRQIYDRWGRVVQVVRTKEMQCYWTGPRRHRW